MEEQNRTRLFVATVPEMVQDRFKTFEFIAKMLFDVYFQVDAIQVEMQKDVRKKAVFEKKLAPLCKNRNRITVTSFSGIQGVC